MLVHAFITTIRASPKPTIFSLLHGFDEIFANFVRRSLLVTLLRKNNSFQLFLVPVGGCLLPLLLLFLISGVLVKVLLFRFPLDRQVVRKLALPTLLAVALLVVLT